MKNRTLLKLVTSILHQLEIVDRPNPNKPGQSYSAYPCGTGKVSIQTNQARQSQYSTRQTLAPSLTTIFNACIKKIISINDFKTGKVLPVFKSGRKGLPSNYRPNTVLTTIASVFERII